MQIYLPIAEMSVNIFLLLGMGGLIGILSGLFGVGGGFLMTPLLILVGIPPAVAVGTEANQIVASSVSGVFSHWRKGNVDLRMGVILSIGGFIGSSLGVAVFSLLRGQGQIELVISICYVIFLGIIGTLMFYESVNATLPRKEPLPINKKQRLGRHTWLHGLPLKVRFRKSKLYISAFLPLIIGFICGILAAIMGVGGGFIMVPAMIYILGMPTQVVIGTSLFQIIFITANTTFLQATFNQTVDIILALILILGGVIGAQIGVRLGTKLRGEELRVLLSLIVLGVCIKLALDLIITPSEPFSVGPLDI
ncbi:MAG: permease [Rhodospirillaceae bacterium]|nr:permease [Rhodospirillaceae bacterium]